MVSALRGARSTPGRRAMTTRTGTSPTARTPKAKGPIASVELHIRGRCFRAGFRLRVRRWRTGKRCQQVWQFMKGAVLLVEFWPRTRRFQATDGTQGSVKNAESVFDLARFIAARV